MKQLLFTKIRYWLAEIHGHVQAMVHHLVGQPPPISVDHLEFSLLLLSTAGVGEETEMSLLLLATVPVTPVVPSLAGDGMGVSTEAS